MFRFLFQEFFFEFKLIDFDLFSSEGTQGTNNFGQNESVNFRLFCKLTISIFFFANFLFLFTPVFFCFK